jgi:hypothetical protein
MTLQVGMLGDDGIVLASDTRIWTEESGRTVSAGFKKVELSEDFRIAVTCSHLMPKSYRVARALIRELSVKSWRTIPLSDMILPLMEAEGMDQHECMVVVADPKPTLLFFCSGVKSDGQWKSAYFAVVDSYAFCGHVGNTATYWPERYFYKDGIKLRPVKELTSLAAQTITDGARFNSGSIGGLEMMYWTESGFQRVPRKDCESLQMRARKVGEDSENILFSAEGA